MSVVQREPVRASHEQARTCRKFHLNDSPTGAEFGGRGKMRCGEFECELVLIQPDAEVALHQFGVSCALIRRDGTVTITVDEGEHPLGNRNTRREINLQPDLTGFDAH